MGVRKDPIRSASRCESRYLSWRTDSTGQKRSLWICLSSPGKGVKVEMPRQEASGAGKKSCVSYHCNTGEVDCDGQ